MSVDCEANNSSAPTSVTVRKRHPSPTLSTTSSTSSTSESRKNVAKFGMSERQQQWMREWMHGKLTGNSLFPGAALLALSESSKIRPHQAKYPGFPGLPQSVVGGIAAAGNGSPNPSPNSHRRTHQSSLSAVGLGGGGAGGGGGGLGVSGTGLPGSAGGGGGHTFGPPPVRAVHERSHSDTSPLPSVDLSAESSSVTSLSSLAIRKAGKIYLGIERIREWCRIEIIMFIVWCIISRRLDDVDGQREWLVLDDQSWRGVGQCPIDTHFVRLQCVSRGLVDRTQFAGGDRWGTGQQQQHVAADNDAEPTETFGHGG